MLRGKRKEGEEEGQTMKKLIKRLSMLRGEGGREGRTEKKGTFFFREEDGDKNRMKRRKGQRRVTKVAWREERRGKRRKVAERKGVKRDVEQWSAEKKNSWVGL